MLGTTQYLVSTSSPTVTCKTAPFDDVGTCNKRVTVPDVSPWGDSSVAYLIKEMSGVRIPAELD